MKRIWRDQHWEWLLVLGITGLGALLRCVALDRLPPGLYHDEAFNGLDAVQVLGGRWPLFFEANNGREPLFIYLAAAAVAILGRSPGALRCVAALVGTLLLPATYLLGRSLYGRREGAIAALLAATTVWTLNLSRVALRAGLLPLGSALALTLLWRGMRDRRPWSMVWAGALYGLTFYTYLAARFSPIALLFFMIYTLVWRRDWFWARGWALFGLSALLVVAPLAGYLLWHWGSTLGRADQVAIWNPAISGGDVWGTLARQAWRTLLAPFVRGDFIPRHNIPLRPVFDPLMALATLGGTAVAVARARKSPANVLVLVWLGAMALPTVLAEGAPHMLRAVGLLPALLLLPAAGLGAASRWLANRGERARRAMYVALALLLAASATSNVMAYWRHLHSEAVYYNFEAGATQLAVEVNRFLGAGWQGEGLAVPTSAPASDRNVYLATRLWQNWASVRYLVPESDAVHVLDTTTSTADLGDGEVLVLLWPYEEPEIALERLPTDHLVAVWEGARERGDLESEDRLLYVAYHVGSTTGAPDNASVRWEQGIRLTGYALQPTGSGNLWVDLYWQTDAPQTESYTVFCHLMQDGVLLGQHDGPPCQGYYGTERWRTGDTVLDRHEVPLSGPYDVDSAQLIVGLYRWEMTSQGPELQHLYVLEPDGAPSATIPVSLAAWPTAN